jgi:hypothetical protein
MITEAYFSEIGMRDTNHGNDIDRQQNFLNAGFYSATTTNPNLSALRSLIEARGWMIDIKPSALQFKEKCLHIGEPLA